jgi:3-oxoacyl-[acyl-carrier-protein] synthase II
MMMLHNAAAANVSCQFGLMGYNSTTTNSCAAATQAIGEATAVIRRGEADIMVAGGAEHPLSDLGLSGFMAMRAITTAHNDCPQRASRPFDLNRSGLVGAEGAASLVLERLEYAQARDAHIYAEVVGFGCSSNAGHLASPDSDGAARAMSNALVDADVAPADVDYINAHATSTPLGDAAETSAIKRVFGGAAYDIPISATKSMTGHTIGASGAISAIVSVLTIRDGIIHPTINYETPDPECDLDYVPNQARKTSVKLALSNSFGMGGQNTALLLSKIN